MKTNTASILLAALFAAMAALPAAAQYAGDEIDWAEKQGFGVLAGHGFVWNEIYGGGGTFAIEYVNSIVHFGLAPARVLHGERERTKTGMSREPLGTATYTSPSA